MKPKKIILIVIDTLRADHMGCYGYKRDTCPNVDRIAKEGILFKYAFSPAPHTIPSHGSIFTSKYPSHHSIGFNQNVFVETGKLNTDIDITLAEILSSINYKTAGFVGGIVLRKDTNFNAGFEVYDDDIGNDPYGRRDGQKTNQRVFDWLEKNHRKDFFLFIHYFDVHGPFHAPDFYKNLFIEDDFYGDPEFLHDNFDMEPKLNSIPNYQILNIIRDKNQNISDFEKDIRYYKAQYDATIRYTDDNLGKLFKKLKDLNIYNDSLIIITSDHGEAFGENDVFLYHGLSVTLDQISIPLILKPHNGLKIERGIIDTHVSTIDIMPTLLSLCNYDYSSLGIEGYSLKKILENKTDAILDERMLLSENERQYALINPSGEMEIQKKDTPTSTYYPHIAALIESLNGKKYCWESGKEYVLNIPFDQYQRYKILSDIINKFRVNKKIFTILDIGASFHGTLKKFLPQDNIYFLDKDYPPEYDKKRFISGDITKLDLTEKYDFVVSIDVYEHIDTISRENFINKLINLSNMATILAAPFDTDGVKEHEVIANEVYKITHGTEYKWLHEHILNGLPSLPFALELIKKSKYSYTVIPNGYLPRWFEMISTYMLTEGIPEFSKSMEELYEFYNKNFYSYDNLNPAYRQVIVINKTNNKPDFSDIYAKNSKLDEKFSINYKSLHSFFEKIRDLSSKTIYKEITEKRNQVTELLGGLRAKDREIIELRSTINGKDTEIIKLKSTINGKDTEIIELKSTINGKDTEIIELKSILLSIHQSLTWRFVIKFQKIIDFLLPLNTHRRHFYDINLRSVRRIVNGEGKNLWNDFKERVIKWIPFRERLRIFYLLELISLKKKKQGKQIKKNSNPTIDIIIPVYNHGKYLQQCIESAINQTYANIKILIVDDHSSEPVVFEILEKYKNHPKIKIDYHTKNKGISETLNDGIIISSGNYLAFLDCDDIIVPDAIEKVVDFIRKNPDKYFIYSDRININKSGEPIEYESFKNRGTNAKEELLIGMYTSHLKVIKRDCFYKVGLFSSKYDSAQDYDIALRISEQFDFGYINDYLYKHRVHEEQTTQKNLTKQENLAKLIKSDAIQRRKIFKGDIGKSISIVMLTFNRLEDTKKSIESIFEHTKLPFDLIILDNNSDQNVREYLQKLEKQKTNVKIIFEDINLGCGRGRKKAVKFAKGDYIVTLDNDICVTPLWLENFIIRIEEDKKIAAACAKVVFPNGKIQYNGGKFDIENDSIKFYLHDSNKNKNDFSTFKEFDCDWIPGGAMILKREFLKKVEYREDIEGAYEDNDYSMQIRNVGGRVVNCPLSEVIHYHLQFSKNILNEKRYLNERYSNKKLMSAFLAFYKYNKLIIKDEDLYKMLNISTKSEEEIRNLINNSLYNYNIIS